MGPCQIILHPSLVISYFTTPPIQLKLNSQIGGEITNSKPAGQVIMIGQSKHGTPVKSYLLHSSLASAQLRCAFYQL
jgi:hypothetical protein